ncbi:hypothetical protein CDD82_7640 [Ophiocordyceps australis]|uniref:Exonuclease V n=1 Tax=Ophiocordyceps australis TaxID=1399860 RepID=A0A2C5ZR37_9HYPO|nr:hypothetical protein CDD82_7640 [Ophiocordyceps australis]
MKEDLVQSNSDSEYGYDFTAEEEQDLINIVNKASRAAAATSSDTTTIIDSLPAYQHGHVEDLGDGTLDTLQDEIFAAADWRGSAADANVCYPDLSLALSQIKQQESSTPSAETAAAVPTPPAAAVPDEQHSPLERFRQYPRKPLTVTDLISGAWCELQYWYILTRLPGGRKTRTAPMRQGTKMHRKLEVEVHTEVRVKVTRREDNFALRLWNVIQGLRTLRETGLTRELEVWGVVNGNLVNGVIDVLSYQNPNPEFEEELANPASQEAMSKQSSLTDIFPADEEQSKASGHNHRIYLADVKTRRSKVAVSQAQLRPAKIQLLLYHSFLSDMAAGKLDFFKVLRRYAMDPDGQFSDTFLTQIGQVHHEIFYDAPSSIQELERARSESLQGTPVSTILGADVVRYQTLRQMLPLVEHELHKTFPQREASLGHILRVQYLHNEDGRQLEVHDFPVSKQVLHEYLKEHMEWWQGEREARGVQVEEAFKCGTCEFAAECEWRQSMDEEQVKKANRRIWAARRDEACGGRV